MPPEDTETELAAQESDDDKTIQGSNALSKTATMEGLGVLEIDDEDEEMDDEEEEDEGKIMVVLSVLHTEPKKVTPKK